MTIEVDTPQPMRLMEWCVHLGGQSMIKMSLQMGFPIAVLWAMFKIAGF